MVAMHNTSKTRIPLPPL